MYLTIITTRQHHPLNSCVPTPHHLHSRPALPLQSILVEQGPASGWDVSHVRVMHAMLYLLTALLHRTADEGSAARLLGLLLEDADMAACWTGFTARVLGDGGEGPPRDAKDKQEK